MPTLRKGGDLGAQVIKPRGAFGQIDVPGFDPRRLSMKPRQFVLFGYERGRIGNAVMFGPKLLDLDHQAQTLQGANTLTIHTDHSVGAVTLEKSISFPNINKRPLSGKILIPALSLN